MDINYNHSWIELDSAALSWNVAQYKLVIGAHKKLAMVIKGNAYGHGAAEIACLANSIVDIDFLAVFSLREALAARAAGSTKPILVMGDIDDACLLFAAHKNIHFVVDEMDQLKELNAVGKELGAIFSIHLKIETGLGRFGVSLEDITSFVACIDQMSHLSLQGVSTHLAEKGAWNSEFSAKQLQRFQNALALLGRPVPFVHATTTIDSLTDHMPQYTLVRIGLGLYGYLPSLEIEEKMQRMRPGFLLRPLLTWKTRIIRIKKILAGESVGYDRSFIAPIDMKIGIIPVGYVDGFDGAFAQLRTVFWNDIALPIIGVIAMNCIVVDLCSVPGIKKGDEVVLFDERVARLILNLETKHNLRVVLSGLNGALKRIPIMCSDRSFSIVAAGREQNQEPSFL